MAEGSPNLELVQPGKVFMLRATSKEDQVLGEGDVRLDSRLRISLNIPPCMSLRHLVALWSNPYQDGTTHDQNAVWCFDEDAEAKKFIIE